MYRLEKQLYYNIIEVPDILEDACGLDCKHLHFLVLVKSRQFSNLIVNVPAAWGRISDQLSKNKTIL